MKILQSGNSNFGYVMARELRKKGVEADLLISHKIIGGQASINDPLLHDMRLSSYPNWIKFGKINSRIAAIDIVRKMKDYDIIHAYNAVPIHAMMSGRPYVAQSGGDDLRIKAFEKSLTGYMLRRAYKKADQFVYVWPIHKYYAEKLSIKNPLYLPRIWDIDYFFEQGKTKNADDEMLKIFLPTIEEWQTKGNDKFLRAFKKLCKDRKKVFLYYVDWGNDSKKAKDELFDSNTINHVEIIPGPISREQMIRYMKNADIVADQFNSGSFTRLGIEAFAFGIPVLINLNEELHEELHGSSPKVINAKDEQEIYQKLSAITDKKDQLKELAIDAKEWVKRNFDLEKNVQKYIKIYEGLLRR